MYCLFQFSSVAFNLRKGKIVEVEKCFFQVHLEKKNVVPVCLLLLYTRLFGVFQ